MHRVLLDGCFERKKQSPQSRGTTMSLMPMSVTTDHSKSTSEFLTNGLSCVRMKPKGIVAVMVNLNPTTKQSVVAMSPEKYPVLIVDIDPLKIPQIAAKLCAISQRYYNSSGAIVKYIDSVIMCLPCIGQLRSVYTTE